MNATILKRSFLLGAIAVLLGAFGSHGLKKLVDAAHIEIYQTAVRYMFYHVFALAIAGLLPDQFPAKFKNWASIFFQTGILFFTGSLLYLTFFNFPVPALGLITPLGGLFLVAGWVSLCWSVSKKQQG